MANSTVDASVEHRLRFACALIVKLKRIGLLTDVLVAAATSFQDLLDDIVTAFGTAAIPLYSSHVYIFIQALEAELMFMQSLGLIDDTITAALTTVNTADAATDLFYLAQSNIPDNAPARTDESFVEFAVGAVAYGSGL